MHGEMGARNWYEQGPSAKKKFIYKGAKKKFIYKGW